jgi:hypothetical protein
MTVNASHKSFLFYRRGILDSKDCKADSIADLTHAVVGVGYGTDKKTGQDYVIIKNSWGKWWGDGGFAKIAADNSYMSGGTCGILKHSHIALIKLEDAKDKVKKARKVIGTAPPK